MMDNFQELANAVVAQAAEDYRKSKVLIAEYESRLKRAKAVKAEIEEFFGSEWFGVICNLDGAEILKRLQEEEPEPTKQDQTAKPPETTKQKEVKDDGSEEVPNSNPTAG